MKAKKVLTILICAVLVAILVSCGLFVFSVKEVVGEFSLFDLSNADRLQSVLDEYKGENLLFMDLGKIRTKVQSDPYFEVTSMGKMFPNVINVGIRERREVFLIDDEESTYVLSEEGYVLSVLSEDRKATLDMRNFISISLDGIEITEKTFGQKISTDCDDYFYSVIEAVNAVDLTDNVKSVIITKKAENADALLSTYTGVDILIYDVKDKCYEKIVAGFDCYINESSDYVKSYYTILVFETIDGVIETQWTSHNT